MLLYIGITFAIVSVFGTFPVSSDIFISLLRGSFIFCLIFLMKSEFRLSIPQLVFGFMDVIIFSISTGSVGDRYSEFEFLFLLRNVSKCLSEGGIAVAKFSPKWLK